MNKKLKIFISAYACEPGLGSEIGVGWHWVLEMAKYFDLWVLTRKSNQSSIEQWFDQHQPDIHIHFLYYDLPPTLRFWKKGIRGVRTYYFLWQKLTNRIVKKTMEVNGIEIYHLLTYGNALWPASVYGKKKFFIWGPIGVGDTIPADFTKHYNIKSRFIEFLRRLSVITLPVNKGFINRCRNANIIFCKTRSTFQSIPIKYRNKALIFTDVAVDPISPSNFFPNIGNSGNIKYLVVGRLDAWRGFDLLIEAFSKAVRIHPNIQLEILGIGPDKKRLYDLTQRLHLGNKVIFSGQVTMHSYYEKLSNCDVVVNPSLKEGAVTTAFDSMSFGKPLICIDTGGYTRYFSDDYAVVIPRTSRLEVIERLYDGIILLSDPEERTVKGEKARKISLQFNWDKKGALIYNEIFTRFSEYLKKEDS